MEILDKDNIIGKEFLQNCGDILIPLEKTEQRKRGNILFRCRFKKYKYEILALKGHIIRGVVNNPQIEIEEFINKIWPQHCGDSLRILRKIEEGKDKGKWEAEFINNNCKICANKGDIIKGKVFNYLKDDFINTKWLQNCGDTLVVIKKSDKKCNNNYYYLCKFIKYSCEILALKANIIKGNVLNPEIENKEFLNKIYPQNCGDSLRILEKTNKKLNSNNYLYKVCFIKYPYVKFCFKKQILKGMVKNPLIEKYEFIDKIWLQNCGDSLRIIEKVTEGKYKGKWKCEFIKYFCVVYKSKGEIIKGTCENPNLPWKTKEGIISIIKNNFKNEKPTLKELSKILDISYNCIESKISKYNLKEYINFSKEGSFLESEIRDYCISLNKSFLKKSTWKELEGKEIDIYSPELKIGIEVNGDYWHSDKIIYNIYGIKSFERDNLKRNLAKEKGIDLYFIWEHDWKRRKEVVKRYLNILINKYNN